MNYEHLGWFLVGASMGGVCMWSVGVWWRQRCWDRLTDAALVREARLCLDDLVGESQAEILALFRAREALHNLAALLRNAECLHPVRQQRVIRTPSRMLMAVQECTACGDQQAGAHHLAPGISSAVSPLSTVKPLTTNFE